MVAEPSGVSISGACVFFVALVCVFARSICNSATMVVAVRRFLFLFMVSHGLCYVALFVALCLRLFVCARAEADLLSAHSAFMCLVLFVHGCECVLCILCLRSLNH